MTKIELTYKGHPDHEPEKLTMVWPELISIVITQEDKNEVDEITTE